MVLTEDSYFPPPLHSSLTTSLGLLKKKNGRALWPLPQTREVLICKSYWYQKCVCEIHCGAVRFVSLEDLFLDRLVSTWKFHHLPQGLSS